MIETRQCRKCAGHAPLRTFQAIPRGRRRTCNVCVGTARRARESGRPARRPQRDTAAERARLRELQRAPKVRRRKAAWAAANATTVNARNRAWRAANRERARAWGRRNARHRRLGYDAETCAWSDVLVADPCAYCGAASSGVDHIDPVARGGTNDVGNLTGACAACNRRKRATPLLLFMLAR